MRQDASTIEQQMMSPCDASSLKQHYSYQDVARACDKWLKAKFPDAPKWGTGYNKYKRAPDTVQQLPAEKAVKAKRVRCRKKYATLAEGRAVMSKAAKDYWLNMSPEQRVAKLQLMAEKRNIAKAKRMEDQS